MRISAARRLMKSNEPISSGGFLVQISQATAIPAASEFRLLADYATHVYRRGSLPCNLGLPM
jgi:hypothetical protein